MQRLKIVDRTIVRDADLNLKWVSTISGIEKGNPRNSERGVNRHQFLELLVRIADEKYIQKLKVTNSISEAFKLLWDEHLKQELENQYNESKWRWERYYNEECDYCLKHYRKIIDHIYKRFSKKKVRPG